MRTALSILRRQRTAALLYVGSVRCCAEMAALAMLLVAAAMPASAAGAPLRLNESFVEDATRVQDLDLADIRSVFAFVFRNLPERVKVYPTEHYYYFRFSHRGVVYGGNLRLENELRDQGKLHFAYTAESNEWLPPGETRHRLLDGTDGIAVERIDDFSYAVTYGGKRVVFDLNRMEGIAPPPGALAPDERYIGPIFDESAVRFFLVYNPRLRQFLYLLDETGPQSDHLVPLEISDRILVGERTGFAYYRDHRIDRRILIGVYAGNARVNNYYDGPFDQLPDNFLEGDVLRDAILDIEPKLKGRIDRYGSSFDGETRYMIAPYLHYEAVDDLAIFHRCAINKRVRPEHYYACFAVDEQASGALQVAAERMLRAKPERPRRKRTAPRRP